MEFGKLATFRTTTSQCAVERQQGRLLPIPMGKKNSLACKTYPMEVEIFQLIFLICWTYEQAIYDITFNLKYIYTFGSESVKRQLCFNNPVGIYHPNGHKMPV